MFDYYISSNEFSPSQYFSKDISDRKELHDIIWKFHLQGWGYTKIHQYLLKNDFEIGKSRTSVYHILKKLNMKLLKFMIPASDAHCIILCTWFCLTSLCTSLSIRFDMVSVPYHSLTQPASAMALNIS